MHKIFCDVKWPRLLGYVLASVMVSLVTSLLAQQASVQSSISAQEEWPWLDEANGKNSITLLLMGDTNIQDREDPGAAYKYVLPTLRAADVRFTNLEGAFAGTSKDPQILDIPHKRTWKHSAPEMVEGLIAAGIDGVGVANNVTYPWQALMRSLNVLEREKIGYTGGGKNLEEAHAPLIIKRKGVRLGFLQYAATVFPYNHEADINRPGIAGIRVYTSYQPPKNLDKPGQPPIVITMIDEQSLQRMVDDISGLRKKVDIVVVSYHWGVSNTTTPVDYQRELAHNAIDAGAHIVMGHGPHKYQPVEIYNGKPIFFSLGNFVFDWPNMRKSPEGLLARAIIKKRTLAGVSLVPVWRDEENNPHLLDPNVGQGRELYGYLLSINGDDGARLTLKGKEIVVEGIQ